MQMDAFDAKYKYNYKPKYKPKPNYKPTCRPKDKTIDRNKIKTAIFSNGTLFFCCDASSEKKRYALFKKILFFSFFQRTKAKAKAANGGQR